MADIQERPGIQEQYQTAGNTSDLTVEADRRGAGDVLISAGLSGQFQESDRQQTYYARRIGMSLLRLHSEWDSAAKPRKPGRQVVEVIAARIKAEDLQEQDRARRTGEAYQQPKGAPMVRAQAEVDRWYASELRLLGNTMKSRPALWEQLALWTAFKGIDPDIAAAALLHWLDPTCPACEGHGVKKVPGQPALSARRCEHDRCDGGRLTPPQGTRPVLDYIDDCLQKARNSIKVRLRPK